MKPNPIASVSKSRLTGVFNSVKDMARYCEVLLGLCYKVLHGLCYKVLLGLCYEVLLGLSQGWKLKANGF